MRDKIYILLTVGISLIILTSPAPAQDEQWLQYHSEREAQRIIVDRGWSTPALTSEMPQGVELPQFTSTAPFFTKWSTPMVEAGYLWISFDRTQKNGPYDGLFIDSNGNGHLNDETVITAYRTDQSYTYFGPVKVVFQGEDGPLTYHLNFRLYNRSERNRQIAVYSGGWYEGTITVAGIKTYCMLIDQNVNGTFNDKSLEAHQCDRIRIGKKGTQDTRYVGNLIEIEGTLYHPEIARDGAFIKLTRAEDVKLGDIRMPETITEFSAGGENGLFKLKLENGTGSLPVGKYRINQWAVEKEDEKGRRWKLQGSGISQKGDFKIVANKETELSIGEPIVSRLSVNKRDSGYSFNQSLGGQRGERIEMTRNGARPPAPKLRIKNKDGSYDRSFSFEYG
ncbi:MAG: hypothetical protein GY845_16555 [Planctomycetes bacterium]|nr:hypothetical protein [Planctomycetota bacterium]